MKRTIAVVTASLGRKTLARAIESVLAQTIECTHYVFLDGPEARTDCVGKCPSQRVKWLTLPANTGGTGFGNAAILAASAYLVTEECIAWLDDDNWFEPDHLETLCAAMGDTYEWAYSLRRLCLPDGSFFANDDCESLGYFPCFDNPNNHLVDANCYLMKRQLATKLAPAWYAKGTYVMVGDRIVFETLATNKIRGACTKRHTVNYRINSKTDMADYFREGNRIQRERYPDGFPWLK